MAWACIDLDPDMPDHPKIIELERQVGIGAITYIIRLWCWAARSCPDGHLNRFPDIAYLERRVMGWEGESGKLLQLLLEAELLIERDGEVIIKNFDVRNAHISAFKKRQARAAKARWKKYWAEKVPPERRMRGSRKV